MPKLAPTGNTQKISLSQILTTGNVRDTYSNIEELAQSIREHGLMQPLVVKRAEPSSDGIQQYELIAGHRRKKAFEYLCSQGEDFTLIDVIVKTGDKLALQLTENIQRDDLNAEERESGISKLADTGISQKEIAHKLSKSEAWISKQLAAHKIRQTLKSKNIDTKKFESGILNVFRTLEEKELIPAIKRLELIGVNRTNAEKLMQEYRSKNTDNIIVKNESQKQEVQSENFSQNKTQEPPKETPFTKTFNETFPSIKKHQQAKEQNLTNKNTNFDDFEAEDKQLSAKDIFFKINAYITAIKDNLENAEKLELEKTKINTAYDIIAILHEDI